MTNLTDLAAQTEALDYVDSASVWKDRRVYVNLCGADRSFAGDRNLKLYHDGKDWIIEGYKGTMSETFAASFTQFRATHETTRR